MSITARPLLGPLLLALAGLAVAAPDAGNLEALRGGMHLDRDPAPARIYADPLKDQGIQDRSIFTSRRWCPIRCVVTRWTSR
ncbi:hypothetical protein MBH78_22530 [Oceanimonas sp. NS1]|nr:hypothetical protein [Oceanimonas sp. NS1]